MTLCVCVCVYVQASWPRHSVPFAGNSQDTHSLLAGPVWL